jgi:hypothetical protein
MHRGKYVLIKLDYDKGGVDYGSSQDILEVNKKWGHNLSVICEELNKGFTGINPFTMIWRVKEDEQSV